MSAENVELVRRAYDAFNRRDWRGYRGEEGLREWREAIMGFIPDYTVEIEEIRDLGNVTLARSVGTGHGAASETPVHDPFWHAGEWREGRCIWWRNCSSEAEALEAIAERAAAGR